MPRNPEIVLCCSCGTGHRVSVPFAGHFVCGCGMEFVGDLFHQPCALGARIPAPPAPGGSDAQCGR